MIKARESPRRWSLTVYFKNEKEYMEVLKRKPSLVNKSVWLRDVIKKTLKIN